MSSFPQDYADKIAAAVLAEAVLGDNAVGRPQEAIKVYREILTSLRTESESRSEDWEADGDS